MNKIHPIHPPPPYSSLEPLMNVNLNNKIVPVGEIKNHFSLSYDINVNEIIINVKDMLKNINYILVINDNNENWKGINRFFQNNFNNLIFIIQLLFDNNNYNIHYDIHYDIYYNHNNTLVFNILHNNIINNFNLTLDFILLKDYLILLKENEIDNIINGFILEENNNGNH